MDDTHTYSLMAMAQGQVLRANNSQYYRKEAGNPQAWLPMNSVLSEGQAELVSV